MKLVKPSFEIMEIMGDRKFLAPLGLIEQAGRTCYKSEGLITESSCQSFVRNILKRGHESVIEHSAMTVKFIVDRGVTHELVRHRLCAFSQESTRYCNYRGGVTFVIPPWVQPEVTPGNYLAVSDWEPQTQCWLQLCIDAEAAYLFLLSQGWSPQQARSVLPNSLKTEIVVTANFREWRHIFTLRCSKKAHEQMREIMLPLLRECKKLIPVIFEDIEEEP